MTPDDLARLHAAAFTTPRPWTAPEFAALLDSPHTFLIARNDAFALGRVIADEAELLTIATDPAHRRKGLGYECLMAFDAAARDRGATTAFLEVATNNQAAIALYTRAGWQPTGLRRGYYAAPDGSRIDAQNMGKTIG
ncbi:GNAT family N-acetyltransferase [Pseudooceanicola sp. MF1-13]|uniref:GNAT family N-acetyltransferase n=1 Tax=Pseudooceanicola sp. MF1-13 TaxID=3379095 RepID=UPI003892ADE1